MLILNPSRYKREGTRFFTHPTAITPATREKPLRLQSLIALESTSPLRAGALFNKLFCWYLKYIKCPSSSVFNSVKSTSSYQRGGTYIIQTLTSYCPEIKTISGWTIHSAQPLTYNSMKSIIPQDAYWCIRSEHRRPLRDAQQSFR